MAETLVVIPARAGSTRLPMKPLHPVAGRTLLSRAVAAARAGTRGTGARLVVAADDARVAAHAEALGAEAVLTPAAITTGSGRALAAARAVAPGVARVVNFQGDAPFPPPDALPAILRSDAAVATPVVQLSWQALDGLREAKRAAPFSGTTCAVAADGRALWFSKQVIPAVRDEATLRAAGPASPVFRHVGLYAYARDALERFEAASPSALERLEGLEQLRLLELGISVHAVMVPAGLFDLGGIDGPADVARAEAMLARHGDPYAAEHLPCAGW